MKTGDNNLQIKIKNTIFFLLTALSSIFLLTAFQAQAADVSLKPISDKLKVKSSETRWISLGAGYRGTGLWTENANGNLDGGHYSNDNARIYLNGQFNQYLKFEVNTECFFCNNTASTENPRMSYNILDAIAKFEYNRYFNIWGGRMLAPTERGELSGPFFKLPTMHLKRPSFLKILVSNLVKVVQVDMVVMMA